MNIAKSTSKKSNISLTTVIRSIILGITLIIVIISSNIILQTSSKTTQETQCLEVLSNLDAFFSTQGTNSRVKALFEETCLPENKTISNTKELKEELSKCNQKAQRIASQREFLSQNPSMCIECSYIKTNTKMSVSTSSLENNKFQIISNEIILEDNMDEHKPLYFSIEDNEIRLGVDPSNSCKSFFNS